MITLRNGILLMAALTAATGTAIYTRDWMAAERQALIDQLTKVEPVETTEAVEVLTAAQTLTPGSFVKPEDFQWVQWPEDGVGEGFIVKGDVEENADGGLIDPLTAFEGAVVRHTITQGEPITSLRLVHPGERGFLAAVLEPGKRAVSVPVDATTGISGFIFPGDMVDVVFTGGVEMDKYKSGGEEENEKRKVLHFSQTLLHDVRVLALDQKSENVDGAVDVADTATLEVSAKQAEKIALGLKLGRLSLTLQSLANVMMEETGLPDEAIRPRTFQEVAQRPAHSSPRSLTKRGLNDAGDGFGPRKEDGSPVVPSYTMEHEMLYMLQDPRFRWRTPAAKTKPPVTIFRADKMDQVAF